MNNTGETTSSIKNVNYKKESYVQLDSRLDNFFLFISEGFQSATTMRLQTAMRLTKFSIDFLHTVKGIIFTILEISIVSSSRVEGVYS